MNALNSLVSGGMLWLGVVLVIAATVGLAMLWVAILRWALRVNELVVLASDTLHELRKIGAHLTGYVVHEPDASVRSVPDAPHGLVPDSGPRTCPRCRLANSPGATHCEKCGAPL